MKLNNFRFFSLMILLFAVGCTGITPTPVIPASNLTTFTDQNKYYQIQLPKDWKHEHPPSAVIIMWIHLHRLMAML